MNGYHVLMKQRSAYDENTQRLQKTTTIQATEVTYGWSVVPLSKESIKEKVDELSAEKVQEPAGRYFFSFSNNDKSNNVIGCS